MTRHYSMNAYHIVADICLFSSCIYIDIGVLLSEALDSKKQSKLYVLYYVIYFINQVDLNSKYLYFILIVNSIHENTEIDIYLKKGSGYVVT